MWRRKYFSCARVPAGSPERFQTPRVRREIPSPIAIGHPALVPGCREIEDGLVGAAAFPGVLRDVAVRLAYLDAGPSQARNVADLDALGVGLGHLGVMDTPVGPIHQHMDPVGHLVERQSLADHPARYSALDAGAVVDGELVHPAIDAVLQHLAVHRFDNVAPLAHGPERSFQVGRQSPLAGLPLVG